jgi:hypothetical protein
MTWKPRLIIAGAVLIVAIILTALGFNHFIEAIGYMAAGFLFGTTPAAVK